MGWLHVAPDIVSILKCSSKFNLNPRDERLAEKALCILIMWQPCLLLASCCPSANKHRHLSVPAEVMLLQRSPRNPRAQNSSRALRQRCHGMLCSLMAGRDVIPCCYLRILLILFITRLIEVVLGNAFFLKTTCGRWMRSQGCGLLYVELCICHLETGLLGTCLLQAGISSFTPAPRWFSVLSS